MWAMLSEGWGSVGSPRDFLNFSQARVRLPRVPGLLVVLTVLAARVAPAVLAAYGALAVLFVRSSFGRACWLGRWQRDRGWARREFR